jgi:hypothetical protein
MHGIFFSPTRSLKKFVVLHREVAAATSKAAINCPPLASPTESA